jgi:hypothetical protein
MRVLKRRVFSSGPWPQRGAEDTFVRPGFGRFIPLPKIAPLPSMNTGTTGAPVRDDR